MRQGASDRTTRPFTLVVCTACAPASAARPLERLRVAVRGCPHGVMVTSGCLGLLSTCRRPAAGLFAVVQPCTRRREPSGPPLRLGPILTMDDAEAVSLWLQAGMPDDGTPPARLPARRSPLRTAHLN
ncbi:hypothetical protein [Streptomyces reniochalinae]|uniref:Uncharacterized protein n=1 Tax=Streptomyces reniochalinae TaxID=2250578 RepID=A0A367EXT6_9ACTN|nr:hypothetical protein [Streptomyces reniochalinae]RCG22207.1 hypothetical protein DQ392_06840 [Streptomyces reniochalinae]